MQHKIETRNFKISLILLHGYHTPKLENIAIFAIAFLLHNFKLYQLSTWIFFGLVIKLIYFLEISRN